jgi:hypothetical protein
MHADVSGKPIIASFFVLIGAAQEIRRRNAGALSSLQ